MIYGSRAWQERKNIEQDSREARRDLLCFLRRALRPDETIRDVIVRQGQGFDINPAILSRAEAKLGLDRLRPAWRAALVLRASGRRTEEIATALHVGRAMAFRYVQRGLTEMIDYIWDKEGEEM